VEWSAQCLEVVSGSIRGPSANAGADCKTFMAGFSLFSAELSLSTPELCGIKPKVSAGAAHGFKLGVQWKHGKGSVAAGPLTLGAGASFDWKKFVKCFNAPPPTTGIDGQEPGNKSNWFSP
jgi:hypothetical protein